MSEKGAFNYYFPQMDIVIPEDRLGDFFFLNDEEEKKAYGTSADYQQAAQLTQQLIKTADKSADKKQKKDSVKQMMDFKVRAVDFLSIFVKQRAFQGDSDVQVKLIRGLLKGLSVAHADKHTILFDRIKSVLALMAKQSNSTAVSSISEGKSPKKSDSGETKLLLNELSRLMLKPQKDAAMARGYSDCFLLLTKHFYDSGDV